MAFKVGFTSVFNNFATIDWSIISSKPQYIGSLIKTEVGDGTLDIAVDAPASNVAYHSGNATLQIWFNTNCTPTNCSDCGGGCFLGSEYVEMADGTIKRLDQVRPGELVACHFSGSAPVLGIRETSVKGNKMFRINKDIITTGEHAFWSPKTREWLVPDKASDHRKTNPLRLIKDQLSGASRPWYIPQGLNPRQMRIGDVIAVGDNLVPITSIVHLPTMPEDSPKLYTLVTTTSFIIRGGYVVSGWSGRDFDKPIHSDVDRRLKMLRGEITT